MENLVNHARKMVEESDMTLDAKMEVLDFLQLDEVLELREYKKLGTVEELKSLKEYQQLEKQGLFLKLSKPFDKDLFKAMRCLASQNAYEIKDKCHMDLWNQTHENEEGYIPMRCGNFEGSVSCPFYQTTYGTCYESGEHEEWLRNLADMLKITI